GIRYRNVTGVQTCALPILVALCGAFLGAVLHEYLMMALVFGLILARFPQLAVNVTLFGVGVVCAFGCVFLFRKLFRPCMVIFTRSEERRVGKGGTTREVRG